MSAKEPTPQESNGTVPDALAVEKRTRRACVESMTIHPHGGGSGMFDVYSESGSEYVVDLRDDVCSCPDFTHREPAGGCKHIRRVRLEFGIEDVPTGVRDEHAAPTDVELARRRRGVGIEENKPKPESGPEIGPVEQAAHQVVMADGGRDTASAQLKANELACELAEIDGVQDFEPFTVVIEEIQNGILRVWSNEERRQNERAAALAESAPIRDLERRATAVRECRIESRHAGG